jgi:hypothetical protein
MLYAIIGSTIFIYFLICIRILYGINDKKTVLVVNKIRNLFKSKYNRKSNSHVSRALRGRED